MQGETSAPPGAAISARRLAFTQAYKEHANYFYGFFCRRTGNVSDAEELSQELWASVYESFAVHQFSHAPLLQRRANQVIGEFARKRKVREGMTYTGEIDALAVSSNFVQPHSQAEEQALVARFWEGFPRVNLTPQQKDVFILYARYGYKIKEIAEQFSLPISTVHDWLKKVQRECIASLNGK